VFRGNNISTTQRRDGAGRIKDIDALAKTANGVTNIRISMATTTETTRENTTTAPTLPVNKTAPSRRSPRRSTTANDAINKGTKAIETMPGIQANGIKNSSPRFEHDPDKKKMEQSYAPMVDRKKMFVDFHELTKKERSRDGNRSRLNLKERSGGKGFKKESVDTDDNNRNVVAISNRPTVRAPVVNCEDSVMSNLSGQCYLFSRGIGPFPCAGTCSLICPSP
jgi:hypothetical protein